MENSAELDAPQAAPIENRVIDEMLRVLGPNGEHWVKGVWATGQFCLMHAVGMGGKNLCVNHEPTMQHIIEAIRNVEPDCLSIAAYNDDPARTFEDILNVLELARTIKLTQASHAEIDARLCERRAIANRILHGNRL